MRSDVSWVGGTPAVRVDSNLIGDVADGVRRRALGTEGNQGATTWWLTVRFGMVDEAPTGIDRRTLCGPSAVISIALLPAQRPATGKGT
jgi:hypothetical protein